MQHLLGFLIMIAALLSAGCDSGLGSEVTTSSPTAEHVAFCQEIMYLDPSVKIDPEGFHWVDWMDDFVLFKFVAHTDDVSQLFLDPPVDTSTMYPGYELDGDRQLTWWDPPSRSLSGASYELPHFKFMHVGYANNGDGTLSVYVLWHER